MNLKTILLALVLAAIPLQAQAGGTGYKNLVKGGMYYYAFNQGFPKSHSIWSAIGITNEDQVYVGVSDHTVNVGLFHYNPNKDTMTYLGDVLGNGKLWMHEWQGKIHTTMPQNPKDGMVYFGTDAGNSLWEYTGDPETSFPGGHWYSIDPKTDKVTDLGLGVRYLGIKSIAVDPVHNRLFATTDPSSHFLTFELDKIKSGVYETYRSGIKDYGCINGTHEPRMTWCDKWGNAYTSNEIGQLVKFTAQTGELLRLNRTLLPRIEGTPSYKTGSGASAIVYGPNRDYIYGVTYYGRLFKHVPSEKGDGAIEDLGSGWYDGQAYYDNLKIGCLALGQNGKLYYVIGGHGMFVTSDTSAILCEFDPDKKTKTSIYKFDKVVTECTGGVTDSKGNVYFAAHGQSVPTPGAEAMRKPYLIKFNPSTIERMK